MKLIGNSMSRKTPTLSEKLAAALLELQRLRGDPIDREHAKLMSAEQICSLFQYDHAAGYACHGADNHPTKLTPLLIADHREKTRADIPAIAKGKRIRKRHAAFEARMRVKEFGISAETLAENIRRFAAAGVTADEFERNIRQASEAATITGEEFKAHIAAFKRKCMANGGNGTPANKGNWPQRRKIPSSPFPKGHRPLRSRSTFEKRRKTVEH